MSQEIGGAEYGGYDISGNIPAASTLGGSLAQNIKLEIVLNLNALVKAGVLNSVLELDYGKDPLTIDAPNGYPFALVGMPIVQSDYEDQATNRRTYRFDVLILSSYDYLQDKNEGIEYIIDAVLNQFDNNFTLKGAAIASVLPVEILTTPISTSDKALIALVATIRAQAIYTIDNPNP
jgi:hypothetical protein